MNFITKLEKIIKKNNSLLCIGLDPVLEKLPKHLQETKDPLFEFNKAIVDVTHDVVCCYKPNIAFYEAYGIEGLKQFKQTVDYIKETYPDIPVLCDAKRGDIGSTAQMYAKSLFEYYTVDAVTVNPYLGIDSVEPFLNYKEKGIVLLCRTSNKGATDFQDVIVKPNQTPLYITVAQKIVAWNTSYGNCLMVVGATWPKQLKQIRKIAPNMFFLIPGIGSQGGDLEKTLKNGLRKDKSGLIITVSRAIIYASTKKNFIQEVSKKAIEIKNEINTFR